MATYTEFLRQHSDERARVRRLYWVCGEEEVFRLHVAARVRDLAGAVPPNVLSLSAADTPEPQVWAHLNQHPLDSERKRLVVVHDAQRLVHLDRLVAWVKDNQTTRSRNAVAVFVSSEPDFENEARDDIARSSSAMIVRCSLPRNPEDRLKRAVEVLARWGEIDPTTAGVLVKRVNFDMHEAWAVMQKANALRTLMPEGRLNVRTVEMLAPRRVEEDVVWSLIALNKRAAVEAVLEGTARPTWVIGTLAGHLEMLSRMNGHLATTSSVREMAHRVGAREQAVRTLMPYARLYSRREAVRRTLLLNRLDNACQHGAEEGVLEALIAMW